MRKSSKASIAKHKAIQQYALTWVKVPIYLREYIEPSSYLADVINHDIVTFPDYVYKIESNNNNLFSRKPYHEVVDAIKDIIINKTSKLTKSKVWRFMDAVIKKDAMYKIYDSNNKDHQQEVFRNILKLAIDNEIPEAAVLQEKIQLLETDNTIDPFYKKEAIKELKKQIRSIGGLELIMSEAMLEYKARDVTLSDIYFPDILINRIYNGISVKFTKYERNIIHWAESQIPGIVNRTLSAILNQNKYLNINYFLPNGIVIDSREKNKLQIFRRIFIKYFELNQVNQISEDQHKSRTKFLVYTGKTLDLLESLVPGFKSNNIYQLNERLQNIRYKVTEITNKVLQASNFIELCQNTKSLIDPKTNSKSYDILSKGEESITKDNVNNSNLLSSNQILGLNLEYANRLEERQRRLRLLENSV